VRPGFLSTGPGLSGRHVSRGAGSLLFCNIENVTACHDADQH